MKFELISSPLVNNSSLLQIVSRLQHLLANPLAGYRSAATWQPMQRWDLNKDIKMTQGTDTLR
jgi:nitrogen-specific signal transduction histidine kinase